MILWEEWSKPYFASANWNQVIFWCARREKWCGAKGSWTRIKMIVLFSIKVQITALSIVFLEEKTFYEMSKRLRIPGRWGNWERILEIWTFHSVDAILRILESPKVEGLWKPSFLWHCLYYIRDRLLFPEFHSKHFSVTFCGLEFHVGFWWH